MTRLSDLGGHATEPDVHLLLAIAIATHPSKRPFLTCKRTKKKSLIILKYVAACGRICQTENVEPAAEIRSSQVATDNLVYILGDAVSTRLLR